MVNVIAAEFGTLPFVTVAEVPILIAPLTVQGFVIVGVDRVIVSNGPAGGTRDSDQDRRVENLVASCCRDLKKVESGV